LSNDPFEEANRLWKEGNLDEAEGALLDILKKRPNAPWALFRVGKIKEQRGESEAAAQYIARAVALNPDLGKNDKSGFWKRFRAASDLLDSRNFAAAEPVFLDLLADKPQSAPVLAKLGRIVGEVGRTTEALSYYDRAIAADATHVWGHIGRAEILAATGAVDEAATILETVAARDPSLTVVKDRLAALRRNQRIDTEGAEGVRIRCWPATAVWPVPDGPRVTVVAWCLAHNPVGRAMVLADLAAELGPSEIVGPIFPSYGEDLWPPLREGTRKIDIRGFQAPSFDVFLEGAIRLVMERPCEVVWVSKPRMPSLIIGFLYKLIHGAAVVLDIDDDELAFVRAETALSLDEFLAGQTPSDWREPYSKRWTQLAVWMVRFADAVTVCNPVLQHRFGGTMVRHARDARLFDAAQTKRDALRSEFGFVPDDKVVLFLGTPRRHKGVLDVARALQTLGDRNAVFCIVGTVLDKELKKELETFSGARIVLHPDQPYARLAELNAMADVVCILQDPLDPIAQSQTPAKLTDAIATGTRVLATSVPPVLDLMEGGQLQAVSDGNLVDALRNALSDHAGQGAAARRAFFRTELSNEANVPRAREAIEEARRQNAPVAGEVLRLFAHLDATMPGSLPYECVAATKGIFRSGARVGPLRTLREGVNVVFFWKQNDSGLYGRRQDMLLKQFAAMPQIARILHIDAPISVDSLNGIANAQGQGRYVVANTMNRFLTIADDEKVARRTFVYRGKDTHLLGRELAGIEAFPNAVEAWLRELGMTENVLAWVCPVLRNFPDVQKRLGFSFIATDVIDDQRQWPMQPGWRAQLERNYRSTFAVADAAFANCEPVARWLKDEGLEALVVPNGMDAPGDIANWPVPGRLKTLPRPIVGYCGNLSHRIDWDLIEYLSEAQPNWSIVLIGEGAKDERHARVVARPNVHALGVLPYEIAQRHIAAFDAAMIPHEASTLSEHMNPLKLYVYRSMGIPVVSTKIANLDDLADEIRTADSPEAFVTGLEEAIAETRARGRVFPSAAAIASFSWSSRAADIWGHLVQVFEDSARKGIAP